MKFEDFTSVMYKLFSRTTSVVFGVIIAFLALGIAIGAVKLFLNLADIMSVSTITGSYKQVISDVLSLFILIELSRSIVDYFNSHTLRLTTILDAGLVFVLREIMIILFEHKAEYEMLLVLALLMFVIGLIRIGTTFVCHILPQKNAGSQVAEID